MSSMKIYKVNQLPSTLEANALYFVASTEAGFVDIYISSNDGSSSRRIVSKADLATLGSGGAAPTVDLKVNEQGQLVFNNNVLNIKPSELTWSSAEW